VAEVVRLRCVILLLLILSSLVFVVELPADLRS